MAWFGHWIWMISKIGKKTKKKLFGKKITMINFLFINRCGEGHHPLMNTIKQVLGPEMNQREKAARRKSSGLSEKNINQVQLEVEEEVFRT